MNLFKKKKVKELIPMEKESMFINHNDFDVRLYDYENNSGIEFLSHSVSNIKFPTHRHEINNKRISISFQIDRKGDNLTKLINAYKNEYLFELDISLGNMLRPTMIFKYEKCKIDNFYIDPLFYSDNEINQKTCVNVDLIFDKCDFNQIHYRELNGVSDSVFVDSTTDAIKNIDNKDKDK